MNNNTCSKCGDGVSNLGEFCDDGNVEGKMGAPLAVLKSKDLHVIMLSIHRYASSNAWTLFVLNV